MRKITPHQIRVKTAKVDITYEHIYINLGMSRSWFYKMIMNNKRYEFTDPNPKWMKLIMDYLDELLKVKRRFKNKAK